LASTNSYWPQQADFSADLTCTWFPWKPVVLDDPKMISSSSLWSTSISYNWPLQALIGLNRQIFLLTWLAPGFHGNQWFWMTQKW